MQDDRRPAIPRRDDAVFEHVAIEPDRSFLWRLDDYPWARSVWNYHPEVEIHLIRHSSGLAYVGDHIGEFHAGHLVIVGPNLPHSFTTPGLGGRVIKGREIVVQFEPERLLAGAAGFPELAQVGPLLRRAARGLEFAGEAARTGWDLLERMGGASPLEAFALLLDLLARMAVTAECRPLASQRFADDFRPGTTADLARLSRALDYMEARYADRITLPEVARAVGLSESAFSRFFRAQTGNGFSEHVASLRIWAARRLLADEARMITDICFEAGFNNISNFNRAFLRSTGMTPSRYRQAIRQRGATPARLAERPG